MAVINRAEIARGHAMAAAHYYHAWRQQEALKEQAQAQYQQWRMHRWTTSLLKIYSLSPHVGFFRRANPV